MANHISTNTVCRAISGLVKERTVESYVRTGGDYRSVQNDTSCIQRFINWLAQCIDQRYASRTLSEVIYKKDALGASFLHVAERILKAKPVQNGAVNIQFEIDHQPLEIVSSADGSGRLFVRHFWTDRELIGIKLPVLKAILLKEYVRLQKLNECPGQKIDLTAFDLTGLDLRGMDFKNCSLPDLVDCRLTDMEFDMTTNFQARRRCEIDDDTVDRLLSHDLLTSNLVVEEFSRNGCRDSLEPAPIMESGFKRLHRYDIEEIFSSNNPDFSSKKRYHLLYNKGEALMVFKTMRFNDIPIDLSYVDLSGLDLADMNLSNVNMFGSNLTGTNFQGANLICANFGRAILWETDMRDAYLERAKMDRAKINILIRRSQHATLLENICSQYDRSNVVSRRLNGLDMMVCCVDD